MMKLPSRIDSIRIRVDKPTKKLVRTEFELQETFNEIK